MTNDDKNIRFGRWLQNTCSWFERIRIYNSMSYDEVKRPQWVQSHFCLIQEEIAHKGLTPDFLNKERRPAFFTSLGDFTILKLYYKFVQAHLGKWF